MTSDDCTGSLLDKDYQPDRIRSNLGPFSEQNLYIDVSQTLLDTMNKHNYFVKEKGKERVIKYYS